MNPNSCWAGTGGWPSRCGCNTSWSSCERCGALALALANGTKQMMTPSIHTIPVCVCVCVCVCVDVVARIACVQCIPILKQTHDTPTQGEAGEALRFAREELAPLGEESVSASACI